MTTMNKTVKITLILLVLNLQIPAFGAVPATLTPLDHFRGTRLQQLQQQTYQGAVSAANAGAGYEAARLLKGLQSSDNDQVSKQATQLLESWGLQDTAGQEGAGQVINHDWESDG